MLNSKVQMFLLQHRFQTLIEVVIAMVLTILILTTLTFFYQQIDFAGREIDIIEAENFKLRFLENRLSTILPKAVSKTDRLKDFVFFTASDEAGLTKPGSTSLIFTYNDEIKLDKGYAYHVIGRLFLDPHNRLMLAYWPTPKWWKSNESPPPPKKDVLLEGVESLSFSFFVPPDKGEPEPAPKPKEGEEPTIEPEKGWSGNWPQNYNRLPAMVKVTITLEGSKAQKSFIFPLSNTKYSIIYE